jgi:hypothetical protein
VGSVIRLLSSYSANTTTSPAATSGAAASSRLLIFAHTLSPSVSVSHSNERNDGPLARGSESCYKWSSTFRIP